jgi:dienelactone hydrolase
MWQIVTALRREQVAGDTVILTGHSMGAALAILAARLPYRGTVSRSDPAITEPYHHVGRSVRLTSFGHGMSAYVAGVRNHRARHHLAF